MADSEDSIPAQCSQLVPEIKTLRRSSGIEMGLMGRLPTGCGSTAYVGW